MKRSAGSPMVSSVDFMWTEVWRVLRPRGRIVLAGQDYGFLALAGTDQDLTDVVLLGLESASASPRAARNYRGLLLNRGFRAPEVVVRTQVLTDHAALAGQLEMAAEAAVRGSLIRRTPTAGSRTRPSAGGRTGSLPRCRPFSPSPRVDLIVSAGLASVWRKSPWEVFQMTSAGIEFRGVVLDSPQPRQLAGFYRDLLGWEIGDDEDTWVTLLPPGGGTKLSFQLEPNYRPPKWPSEKDQQQMMLHLDLHAQDVGASERRAVDLGATVMPWQPQDDVRVLADPDGHIFCLF